MNEVVTTVPVKVLFDQAERQMAEQGITGRICRLEAGRKGVIQLELMAGKQQTWYAWNENELSKLKIARDRKLPLAVRLRDKSFARRVKPLSYRPGKRLTLLDQSGSKPRILKGFRQGHLDRMVRKYEIANQAFAGRGVHAPEIMDYDTGAQALVMVFKAGDRLRLSADTADLFHVAGEGLRDFQNHDAMAGEDTFRCHDELQVLDQRHARLNSAGVEPPRHWPELRQRIDDAALALPAPVDGLAHRDLHDKQFIQQANYLSILDFDLMRPADTTLDPANFLAHLVLRKMQDAVGATQRSIDVCGKKFLQGLDRNEDPAFWERLRFYQATTFCRLALVYLVRPRWSHLTADLVTMGNRCLDDLDRIRGR